MESSIEMMLQKELLLLLLFVFQHLQLRSKGKEEEGLYCRQIFTGISS